MAYSIINRSFFVDILADTEADIATITANTDTGSRIIVAETGNIYRANTKGEWVKQGSVQLDEIKALIAANKPVSPSYAKSGTLTVAASGTESITPDADTVICNSVFVNDDTAGAVTVTYHPINGNTAVFTLKAGEAVEQKLNCTEIVVSNATGAAISVRYIVTECDA
jgi:hypothetical protein